MCRDQHGKLPTGEWLQGYLQLNIYHLFRQYGLLDTCNEDFRKHRQEQWRCQALAYMLQHLSSEIEVLTRIENV